MGLKDIYYSIEDKYYSLIEKTPLTKITDKIDSIVPSFAVLIALIILISGFLVLPFFGGEEYSFTVTIKDEQGKKLEGIKVNVFIGEEKQVLTTDSEGKISLKAKKDLKIKIEIDNKKYEFIEKQFNLTENELSFEVELKKIEAEPAEANLKFTDKSGKYITGKEITVNLSCSNSSIKPSPSTVKDSDKDGEIKINIPKGCGKLVINSVEVEGYENWFGTINSAVETIKLNAIFLGQALGDLKVIVENSNGELLDDIKVSLMKGNSKIDQKYTVDGTAEFTGIEIGFYDLKLEDEKNGFEPKRVYSVEIENEKINERTVEMQPTKKGTLKINILDKETNSKIKNSEVIIENELGEIIGERNTGETGNTIEFGLYSTEKLIIKARAEKYLPEKTEINPETQKEVEIKLEKITAENSGKLKIILVDEDKKNIANARVMLKDEDGSLLTEYPEKFSDAEGIVEYTGIKKGIYFAYAEKYPASGLSDSFEIKLTEKTEIELKLIIGTAKIELQTITKDGEFIPNTRVKVKSIDEEKTYTLNSEGKTTLEIKADKRVFFEFFDSKNVYSKYTTKEYQLLPKNYFITATMPEQNLGENLWIELKGVYLNDTKQTILAGGKKYKAVLELFVPENESYEEAGIHFRTGEDENPFIENDLVWIEKINVSNASKIKGTTWNPKKGQQTDFDSDNSASSNAKAKWTNILWNNVEPGVYEAEIELRIREGTGDKEKVSLSFRAWGKGRNYYYFPADNELGSSSSTTTKQGLYAETFQKEFNTEEEVPVCMENNLCLSKQRLEDKTKEPFIIQKKLPFEAGANGNYEYSFKIVNNSQSIYDEPELWIELIDATGNLTEEAEISYYEIKTSEGNSKTKEVNSNETQGISLGLYGRQSVIEGIIGIKTKNTGNTFVNLKIFEKVNNGSNKIFDNEKKTEIKIKSGKALEIELMPELIPAFAETPATIIIKDLDGIEVEQARVKLNVIEEGNRKITIEEKQTNRFGETEFLIPVLEPNTKIEFIAEKFEFETAVKQVILSENVFVVEPETINETLSQRNNPEITKEITIKNLLETDLKIEKIELINETGYFEEFIEMGLINAVFDSFNGTIINSYPQEFNGQLFKVKLQSGLPEGYTSSAKGIMTIKLKNERFNASYSKDIKVELNLGQGQAINNASCLEIENGEAIFSRQTTSNPVQLSYKIVNNCIDDSGAGIKVRNLKAKIEWTDKKGTVSLQMKGRTADLKTTLFTDFSSVVNEREEMLVLLTYTPDAELTGEEGQTEFNVIIEAEINTSSGIQIIRTNPPLIKGTIGNVELLECIVFDPKPKIGTIIESGSEEANFSITNNCGMEIELRFCKGDTRCTGGTEGGIIVKPDTIVSSLKIGTGNNNAEQVTVKRTSIPGIYGITIEAKNAGEAWREISVYDVLVKPNAGHYFSLGDYTIKVPEKNNPDIIELYNNRLFTNVDVDASDCVWETAQEKSFGRSLLEFGGLASGGAGTALLVMMAYSGPAGWLTAGIGAVIGLVVCLFACSDPCDERTTDTLQDYLINLSGTGVIMSKRNSPNLAGIELTINGISTGYSSEAAILDYTNGPPGKETLPLTFTKITDSYNNIKPTYGILTINATEHNQLTELNVPENNDDRAGDLVLYGLPDKYSNGNADYNNLTEIQRKFHVRAITKRFIEEIPPLQRSLDCVKPNGEIGGIGEQALPKIKLNWDWDKIAFNECEEGNENYIYCDSSQFSVMLNKRIHKIDEFMQKNNFSFSCPVNPVTAINEVQWNASRTNIIENGKIGIKEVQIETNKETGITTVLAVIENKTSVSMNLNPEINITIPEGIEFTGESSCVTSTGNIASNSTKEVSCEFELPETNELYKIEIKHISKTDFDALSEEEQGKYNQNIFNINYRLNQISSCWAGTTTGIYSGLFSLNLYLNKLDPKFGEYVTQNEVRINGHSVQTDSQEIINVIKEIKKLSHFNVYMMKDGFSEDFKQDFADYYENTAFLEGATWFTDSDSTTKNNELAEYYKQGLISFNRKYLNQEQFELPEPGLYRVDLSIDYTGDKWNLFDSEGNPKAKIKVEFTRLPSPTPNSIFYYLPFDGKIGEENFAYHRIGYGTGYTNLREEQLKINSQTILSSSQASSNPLNEMTIEKSDLLTEMNSEEETRGSILNLNYNGDELNLKFYPSKATPVALKMHHVQTTENDEFSYYYGMQESNLPVTAGNRLAFWKGMGSCRDFEGKFVQQYKQWDSKYSSESQNLYEVNWNNAIKGGSTYLKTVLYTPIERNISLKVNETGSLQNSSLFTSNEENSPLVSLNGISGMEFNNANQGTSSYLQNIENVFELVRNGNACISQNDVSMNIYWNEAELFRTQGLTKSLNELEDSLIAGTNCIG